MFFCFQAEDGIRDSPVTGVQTCALPISGENLTNRPRRALVLHAMRSDARYAKEHLGKGNGPIYSRYRKLGSDDMDENYFPVLWRSDGYRTTMIDAYLAE